MALSKATIQSGIVEGIPCGNPSFTVFKGIPYALPPVGELRWKEPVDPDEWTGVRVCDTFPPAAIQRKAAPGEFYHKEFFQTDFTVSEDCLYLNVWTPADSTDEKLPVMMWIHGGAYQGGSGMRLSSTGSFLQTESRIGYDQLSAWSIGFFCSS